MRHIKNENGATSVLVIFMMIVLVTFGAFAITSARVNLNFAGSATDWTEQYYELDGDGQVFLCNLDALLYKAAQESGGDEYAFWDILDTLVQGTFAEKYPGAELRGELDDDLESRSYMTCTVDSAAHHIAIEALINDPGDGPRYVITEWRQWQNSSEYVNQETDVWQPNTGGGDDEGAGGGGVWQPGLGN